MKGWASLRRRTPGRIGGVDLVMANYTGWCFFRRSSPLLAAGDRSGFVGAQILCAMDACLPICCNRPVKPGSHESVTAHETVGRGLAASGIKSMLTVRSNSSKSSGLKSRLGSCPCAPVA